MSPTLATQIPAGERALLEGGATRARTRALDLRRRPVDAADAQMQDQKRATAQRERVLIRTRTVWVTRGMFKKPEHRYDVLRIGGTGGGLELLARGCAWWEEAVSLAADALRGRVSVSLSGTRTQFFGSGRRVLTSVGDITTQATQPKVALSKQANGDVEVRLK